jgi:hypothetical protein
MSGTYNTVGGSVLVLGGDGMISHLDQDNPGYQFVTTQYNNYYLLNANGAIIKNLLPKELKISTNKLLEEKALL